MDVLQRRLERLPEKSYYRIGEVARITGVKPYVLRYWETEFKAMVPAKSRSKQRMYRRRDIETILRIKHLLYDRRFTIEGARRALAAESRSTGAPSGSRTEETRTLLARARGSLERARDLLAG